jgi:hypothetical protein
MERLDQRAVTSGYSSDEVVAQEADRIRRAFHGRTIPQDGAKGGRDLRLHVGGDVGSEQGARLLANAAADWHERGGGAVWSFSHTWRRIRRDSWRPISILASVERAEDIDLAAQAGYAAAVVVPHFPSSRSFRLQGSTARIVACPAESVGATCVRCRLCLDADALSKSNTAIAFAAHGSGAKRVREALVQLRRGPAQSNAAETTAR